MTDREQLERLWADQMLRLLEQARAGHVDFTKPPSNADCQFDRDAYREECWRTQSEELP